ncbi:hypothetical protein CDL15_Pgr023358 [Punica granatum]|uniref:Uncharacterized protein n=1 Tax=Punica granatum TaxID=22663 RepID=A0A218Y134_PUNGR|nr:hypothetical protein CDL15_Pgr023358 [Punica granatum]PKI54628.1 hypothetical protein CRG98_024979 [Punica granatum]
MKKMFPASSARATMPFFFFFFFFVVLVMLLSLAGESRARPLSRVQGSGSGAPQESFEVTVRKLAAMLPRGPRVPPSGPSPGIN